MATASQIGIKLTLDGAQQAEAGLRRVSGGLDSVSDASVSAKAALAGLAGAFAGAVSMQQFVQAADAVTTLNNQLKLATGSTQAAGVAYNELYEIAQRSRVSFTELGGTFASISRAGQSLGKSQGQLLTVTEAISNAMAIGGGSAEGMQAALVQLSQGMASGTLRGEELNSVMEQTPRLAQAIADGLGIPTGKLREMGAAGQLTAEQVIEALTRQSDVLKKEVAGSATTVAQAMVTLGNATTVAAGEFAKASGISATLASAIGSVTTAVDAMGKAFAGSEVPIKTTMGVLAGAGAAAGVAALASNIGKVTAAVRVLGAALTGNPYVLALMGIGMAVGGFISYNSAQSKTLEGMKATLKELESLNARGRTGMYGNKVSDEVWNKRQEDIRRLRQEIALLDAQSLDTRAEDARLAATKESAAATDDARQALAALTGQHKEYLPTLEKYQGWLVAGKVTQEQYVALVTDLAKKNYKLDESHKKLKEGYVAGRDAAELYGKAVLSAGHMLAQAEGKVLDLDKAQTELAELQKDPLWAQMPQTWRDIIEAHYGAASAAIRQKEANEGVAKAYAESFEASTRETKSLEDQIKAREAEVAAIGQSHEATAELAAGKLDLAAAEKEAYAAALEGASAYAGEFKDLYLREAEAARDQAGKLRRLAGLEREKGIREAAEDASKEWAKAAEKIENTLTDALMRGFESGKGFAEVLRDTVVNMFKTMVLRPVVSAIVNPVAGALTGAMGFSGAANAGQGSAVGALGQSAAGSWLGNTLTLGGSSLAAIGSSIGTGFMATVTGQSVSAAASAYSAAGMSGVSAGLQVGAAMPYIAAAVAVAAVVAKGLSREKISEGVQGHWSGAATGFTGAEWEFHKGGWARSDKTVNRAVSAGTQTALDSAFDSVSAGVLAFNKALGGSADTLADWSHFMQQNLMGLSPEKAQEVLAGEIGKMTESMAREVLFDLGKGSLGGDVLGGIDAKQARIAELETAMMDRGARRNTWLGWQAERDALQAEVDALYNTVIGPFQKAGEAAQQTLARLGGSLGTINAAFDTLGYTLLQGVAGAQQASNVLDAFGGADAFNQLASSYYQAFYSESERTATTTRQVAEQLARLGYAMPATRDEFRALVEAQDLTTESGRSTFAALMGVSGAFAQVVPASTLAKTAAERYADALQAETDARTRAAEASARVTETFASWQSALRALSDYGATLQGNIASTQDAINALRQQATDNLTGAQQAFVQAASAVRDERDRTAAAVTAATDGVASAQQALVQAISGVAGVLQSQADAVTAARDREAQARNALTDAFLSAQDRYAQAQRALVDLQVQSAQRLRAAGSSVRDYLSKLTGAQGADAGYSLAFNRARFDELAAQALAGDSTALDKLTAQADAFLESSRAASRSAEQYQSDMLRVRTVLGSVADAVDRLAGPAQAAGAAESDPLVQATRAVADAVSDMERARTAAQEASAPLVKAQADLLTEWRTASAGATAAQQAYDDMLARVSASSVDMTLQNSADALGAALGAVTAAQTGVSNAQAALTRAETDAAAAATAWAAALGDAARLGVEIPQSLAGLPVLTGNVADAAAALEAAQADYLSVSGSLLEQGATLADQYGQLQGQLAGYVSDMESYRERVAGVDFTKLLPADPLGELLGNLTAAEGDYATALVSASDAVIALASASSAAATALAALPVGQSGHLTATPDASAAPRSAQDYIDSYYVQALGRHMESGIYESYWQPQLAAGKTLSQIQQTLNATASDIGWGGMGRDEQIAYLMSADPTRADDYWRSLFIDGSHAAGLARVPYDGYVAELHQGERVLTASEAAVYPARSTVGGQSEIVAELRVLREQVARLQAEVAGARSDNAVQQRAIKTDLGDVSNTLRKFDVQGMPAVRA